MGNLNNKPETTVIIASVHMASCDAYKLT